MATAASTSRRESERAFLEIETSVGESRRGSLLPVSGRSSFQEDGGSQSKRGSVATIVPLSALPNASFGAAPGNYPELERVNHSESPAQLEASRRSMLKSLMGLTSNPERDLGRGAFARYLLISSDQFYSHKMSNKFNFYRDLVRSYRLFLGGIFEERVASCIRGALQKRPADTKADKPTDVVLFLPVSLFAFILLAV
jgi:hypothetical protein